METLLWLLLLVSFAFGSSIRRWWRRVVEQGRAAQRPAPAPEPSADVQHDERRRVGRAAVRKARSTLAARGTAEEADARSRDVRPLGDRADLRRAIVLMAVLGPCRAERPHDPGRGS
jgi:hypothetical protein